MIWQAVPLLTYDGVLLALDNELPTVAHDLQRKTVDFFDRVIRNEEF